MGLRYVVSSVLAREDPGLTFAVILTNRIWPNDRTGRYLRPSSAPCLPKLTLKENLKFRLLRNVEFVTLTRCSRHVVKPINVVKRWHKGTGYPSYKNKNVRARGYGDTGHNSPLSLNIIF